MSNAPEKVLASLEQQLAAPDLQNTTANKQGSKSVLKTKKTETKKNEKAPKPQKSVEENSKQQGKFVELPGAEMGKVVVRFPPEASGYLHIGHAKAALLNQHYQLAFNGRLIMRFDDTNPAKEKEDFEKVILEDVDMLKIKPDTFTYTSDHFDKMLDICENGMLKEGLAYVDDTDGDKIRLEREQRIDSINRNNSIEKNLELWRQMVLGTEIGQKCCVRAKIDMQSANGCLRDPTIYRCKPEHHPRTGDKYKVYPTYDFACPIVDSFEGVTHCLRTTEYTDRDAQYYWFCDALKLGTRSNETRPYVWSYSRLNMTNTVLSKRKLTWFVEQGHVDGWDDPRMPTVRGVFRRGMQVEALKQFIVAQGSSRTVTAMQWDKIWALNRSIVDSIAPRHTALLLSNSNKENVELSYPPVEVVVENVKKPYKIDNVPKHPKNSQLGLKNCVWAAPKILIDYSDAELLEAGRRATFINWGNLLINRIEKNQNNNKIERIHAVSDLENTDFKSTVKVTWLPKTDYSESDEVLPILVPVVCVYFDHLISKAVLAKDDDFKQYLNTENSRWELQMIGDSELKDLKKGDVIQLQRRGYFICDSTYQPYSIHTGKETPLVLFNIPDGHTKSATPITTVPLPITKSNIKQNTNKNIDTVISEINDQANKIHVMTAALEEAEKALQALKAEYKICTGVDFPAGGIPTAQVVSTSNFDQSKPSVDAIVLKINEQGDKVRSMKNSKASKADIGEAVKVLLALKAEYKSVAGVDFPAGGIPTPQVVSSSNSDQSKPSVDAIVLKINEQGDKVRSMKNSKASKADIGEAVKVLLALKAEYKSVAGIDFPAGGIPTPQVVSSSNSDQSKPSVDAIVLKINEQGDKVRSMKNSKASKADIGEAVKVLLALKAEYKSVAGVDFPAGGIPTPQVVSSSNSDQSKPSVDAIVLKINEQGDKVRSMKNSKASKADIGEAVKVLLALKAEYKSVAGIDFPAGGIPTPQVVSSSNSDQSKPSVDAIVLKINEQGDKVRSMKNSKASKADIGEAVKVLLALKAEYKSVAGVDFPAGGIPTPQVVSSSNSDQSKPSVDAIVLKINEQGDKVRSMKNSKASKADIGEAVKVLLALKAEYKSVAGIDFPAGGIPTPQVVSSSNSDQSKPSVDAIVLKINEQGDKVRSMKNSKASKADIGEAVKVLLALKAEYKSVAGVDFPAGGIPTPQQADKSNSELSKPSSADAIVRHSNEQDDKTRLMKNSNASKDKKSKKKENIAVVTTKTSDTTNTKKVTKLGLDVLKVSENLGEWYSQVLVKGEMIEYYDVSGCYVLRPWAYRIWELIQEWFDARIKRNPLNVRNCYFPMFVSQGALEREKEHIADFAPEVAWVTKSGETDLAEPIAIRPTSETGMYPAFAKWIQSYRDLPLKLNQWNSVVRWEFKNPQPFLRTREFLWQEGHNAYATREEAERDILVTLGYYEYVYKNMLAVPVIKGKKTEKEKFAGGVFTTTCEAYIASSGRAIQGATSHYLGTNFAKMFDVHFEHPDTHEKSFVHQISFGLTTRTIGVMVMVHGDDRGLVLPPRIASIQVIIVPCGVGVSTANEVKDNLTRTCLDVCNRLKGDSVIENDDDNDNSVTQHRNSSLMIRADTDLRDNYSPGWKFNHWELKGVPLRLEIGPKDLDRNQMVAVRRDNGDKLTIPLEGRPKDDGGNDKMVVRITELLNQIQQDMYNKAEREMKENVVICRKWSECVANLAEKRLLLIPFCGRPSCEDNIKRDTTLDDGTAEVGASTMGAKSLCVPFEQPKGAEILKSNDQCIHPECGQPAGSFTLFGRSY